MVQRCPSPMKHDLVWVIFLLLSCQRTARSVNRCHTRALPSKAMSVEPALHLDLIGLSTRVPLVTRNIGRKTYIFVNALSLRSIPRIYTSRLSRWLTTTATETDLAYGGRVSQSGTELDFAQSDGIEHPVNRRGSTEYRAYCRAQAEVCLKHIMPGLRKVWLSDAGAQSRQCMSRIEQPESRMWVPVDCIAVGSDDDVMCSDCPRSDPSMCHTQLVARWSIMVVVLSNIRKNGRLICRGSQTG